MQALVALTTFSERKRALAFARTVVKEQLAACVNVLPGVQSVYRWQGAVHEDAEVLCVIKTTRARFTALRRRLAALHPYEVPELIALPIVDGSAPYLRWLAAAVRPARR
jgi:periplasmic divalent cation tolerance protein